MDNKESINLISEIIRTHDIIMKVGSEMISIPPLDVFQEGLILQQYKQLGDTTKKKEIFTDLHTAQIAHTIIKIATGKEFEKIDDAIIVLSMIEKFVILPIYTFFQNKHIDEWLHSSKIKNKTQIDFKPLESNFELLCMVSRVITRMSIPDRYAKYLGLRFFVWANIYLYREELRDTRHNISLLSEAAITANSNYVSKKRRIPFEGTLKQISLGLGYDANETSAEDILRNSEQMSGAEFFEKFVRNSKN